MLFSQTRDLAGNILLEQAVREEMQQHSPNRIEFLTENLDAIHFSDQAHFRLFEDYLGKKYAGQKLDLILAFSSRDYRLAGELPETLFPEVPVVFVAVNELEVPQAISKLGVTGIVQRFNLRGNLGLIMRLQPDTRRVVVIGGTSEVDRATLGRIQEAAQAMEGIVFDFWTNRPGGGIAGGGQGIVQWHGDIAGHGSNRCDGQHFFMSQLAEMLAPSADVPVYVLGGSSSAAERWVAWWWILRIWAREPAGWRFACWVVPTRKSCPSRWRPRERRCWTGAHCGTGASRKIACQPMQSFVSGRRACGMNTGI